MITYLDAAGGKLGLYGEGYTLLGEGATPEEVYAVIRKHGMAGDVMCGSSMNHADEYGFEFACGAEDLLDAALTLGAERRKEEAADKRTQTIQAHLNLAAHEVNLRAALSLSRRYSALVSEARELLHNSTHLLSQGAEGGALYEGMTGEKHEGESLQTVATWNVNRLEAALAPVLRSVKPCKGKSKG